MKGIKIGDDIVTRHTPPLKGICTQILYRGRGQKEYMISHNVEGKVSNTWLDPCEIEPVGDEDKIGFKRCSI